MTESYPTGNNDMQLFVELFSTNGLPISDQEAKALLEDPQVNSFVERISAMLNDPDSINVMPSDEAQQKLKAYANLVQLTRNEIYEFIGQVEVIVALDNRTVVEAKDVENLCKIWDWQREKRASQVHSTVVH